MDVAGMHVPPDEAGLRALLSGVFGMDSFRPGQREVIDCLLRGDSALAVFPTGSGKSLCYQLPALCLEGLTLVVSPLIALMKDQVERLASRGIPAARIDSTLAEDEIEGIFADVATGRLRMLYISPERLAASAFRKRLKGIDVPLMAIDEAHCISEWGHNFRPDYLKIARMARRLGVGRVLALTATATRPVERDIRKNFRIATAACFRTGVLRPNLRLSAIACDKPEKDSRLLEILRELQGQAVVYATTRHDTERIATLLLKHGFSAASYHAGLEPELRSRTQEGFMQNTIRIVVATIAFGMGIDKPDIRAVIHYHLPKSLEGYSQEIGRAGRDGAPASCMLLAGDADTRILENFIHGSTPSPQGLKNLLDRILRMAAPGGTFAVSPYDLALTHDMREETVRTVLAYLELDGILHLRGSYHDYFRIRPVRTVEQILAGRAATEKRLIRKLLDAGESAYGSLHFRLQEIADQTGISREKAATTLVALGEAGDVRMEQRGLRSVYQLDRSCNSGNPDIMETMSRRFDDRAGHEHGRIRDVLAYVQGRGCRAVLLARHFGDKGIAPCGVCDLCSGAKPVRLKAADAPPIPDDEWAAMSKLRAENHPSLATAVQIARFLCGIPSPASHKAKLQQRPEFGMWEHLRFADVLAMMVA